MISYSQKIFVSIDLFLFLELPATNKANRGILGEVESKTGKLRKTGYYNYNILVSLLPF